jgi:hypothetical protein
MTQMIRNATIRGKALLSNMGMEGVRMSKITVIPAKAGIQR